MLAGPPWANDFEVPKNKPVPMVPVDPQEVSPFGTKILAREEPTHRRLRSSVLAWRTSLGEDYRALPPG